MCIPTQDMLEKSLSIESLNSDFWLDEIENMEKEGINFVNLSKIDIHMKKKIGAAIGAIVTIIVGTIVAMVSRLKPWEW